MPQVKQHTCIRASFPPTAGLSPLLHGGRRTPLHHHPPPLPCALQQNHRWVRGEDNNATPLPMSHLAESTTKRTNPSPFTRDYRVADSSMRLSPIFGPPTRVQPKEIRTSGGLVVGQMRPEWEGLFLLRPRPSTLHPQAVMQNGRGCSLKYKRRPQLEVFLCLGQYRSK